jgi:RimJ/RimL family protein N-acetyltransferase
MLIRSPRLSLRRWRDADRAAFAALHADPEVMADLGGPRDRAASDAKLEHYADAFVRHGFCRWAVERLDGAFLGAVGIMPGPDEHPLGAHVELGWRLVRHAWGQGYATEAAQAALADAFDRVGLDEILAYTAGDNLRSQKVMARLELKRDPSRDFAFDYGGDNPWHGLVWAARRR